MNCSAFSRAINRHGGSCDAPTIQPIGPWQHPEGAIAARMARASGRWHKNITPTPLQA
jgi:hypothetical protein